VFYAITGGRDRPAGRRGSLAAPINDVTKISMASPAVQLGNEGCLLHCMSPEMALFCRVHRHLKATDVHLITDAFCSAGKRPRMTLAV